MHRMGHGGSMAYPPCLSRSAIYLAIHPLKSGSSACLKVNGDTHWESCTSRRARRSEKIECINHPADLGTLHLWGCFLAEDGLERVHVQMLSGQQTLSLAFLLSRSRNRFASGTFIPPYIARHFVEGRVNEATLKAELLYWQTSFILLDGPYDFFFAESSHLDD